MRQRVRTYPSRGVRRAPLHRRALGLRLHLHLRRLDRTQATFEHLQRQMLTVAHVRQLRGEADELPAARFLEQRRETLLPVC